MKAERHATRRSPTRRALRRERHAPRPRPARSTPAESTSAPAAAHNTDASSCAVAVAVVACREVAHRAIDPVSHRSFDRGEQKSQVEYEEIDVRDGDRYA